MGFNSKINWSKNFTLDNSTTFHSEYEKKSDVSVAPFMLSVPGFVKALFLRKFTDAGPLVLETVVVEGGTYNATCSDDLILFKIDTTTAADQVVYLPLASACSGALFIVKDDLGVAGTLNPHNPGKNYKIIVATSGSDLIDGASTAVIENQSGAVWLLSDGSSYHLLEVY